MAAAFISAGLRRGTRRTFAGLGVTAAIAGPADADFRTRPSVMRAFAIAVVYGRVWSAHQNLGCGRGGRSQQPHGGNGGLGGRGGNGRHPPHGGTIIGGLGLQHPQLSVFSLQSQQLLQLLSEQSDGVIRTGLHRLEASGRTGRQHVV